MFLLRQGCRRRTGYGGQYGGQVVDFGFWILKGRDDPAVVVRDSRRMAARANRETVSP